MNKTGITGADAPNACEQMIRSLVPFFAGLDALAESQVRDQNPAVVDHIFDVLARIGHDQARGAGLFSSPDLHPEAPFMVYFFDAGPLTGSLPAMIVTRSTAIRVEIAE